MDANNSEPGTGSKDSPDAAFPGRREFTGMIERQECILCGAYTGRCEDDSIYVGDIGPLCEDCLDELEART